MLHLIAIAFVLAIVYSFLVFFRINEVYRFSMDLVAIVGELSTKDIQNGRPWEWRYKALQDVDDTKMWLQVWKPLKPEVWYKDLSFLEDNNNG